MLNVGEAMAVPLIRQVKEETIDTWVHIIDAPPGTACPLVATIVDADIVVMVTEPTPFGLHDLSIAVAVTEKLKIPLGLVINREREKFQPLEKYIRDNRMGVISRIPEDRRIAECYSRGQIIIEALPEYRPLFSDLAINIGKAFGKSVTGVKT